ncbi:hypothetical protein [Mesorhizobium marinum]|uniref:hypothetical protein n=1 Tax=Mesorhizobium marinum TaxID=3228790 RepID=UPI0034660245
MEEGAARISDVDGVEMRRPAQGPHQELALDVEIRRRLRGERWQHRAGGDEVVAVLEHGLVEVDRPPGEKPDLLFRRFQRGPATFVEGQPHQRNRDRDQKQDDDDAEVDAQRLRPAKHALLAGVVVAGHGARRGLVLPVHS